MLNGQSVLGLIDSGNLIVNVISEDFAKRLYGTNNLRRFVSALPGCQSIGTAKKGARLPVIGVVQKPLRLRFGGSGVTFRTRPLVIRGLSHDLNISGPYLAKNNIDQLHSKGALKVRGKLVPLFRNDHSRKIQTIMATHAPTNRAYVQTECVVPSGHMSAVSIRIPNVENGRFDSGPGYLTGSEQFMEKLDVHPALHSIVETDSNGRCSTTVFNSLPHEVVIPGGVYFGEYQPVCDAAGSTPHGYLPVPKLHNLDGCINSMPGPDDSPLVHNETEAQSRKWLREVFQLDQCDALESDKDRQDAEDLLWKYNKLFSRNDEYGHTDLVVHEIHTTPGPPLKAKGRPIPPSLEGALNDQLDKWLKQDVIEVSTSDYSFPLLAVPKKNKTYRFCVDFRLLNSRTRSSSWPVPDIQDNLARLSGSRVFSALDLSGAFHAISIKEEDRHKTAFPTHRGLFQFKAMPFGLSTAPQSYCRLSSLVLEGIPTSVCLPYLDDCCVHNSCLRDALKSLDRVFGAHQKAGLMVQPVKCSIFRLSVEYLGHLVSKDGVATVPKYTEIVRTWPEPQTLSQLRGAIGKMSYYKRFLKDFSKRAAPLHHYLVKENWREDGKVELDEKARNAFFELRDALTKTPILAYPDFGSEEPFILDTDWSLDPGAIGGVLSQVQNGQERVIAFGSRKTTKSEGRYSSYKGEMLAIIHFIRHWRYFFRYRKFLVRSDNKALTWIRTCDPPQGMILRWLEVLAGHDFTVEFRPGKDHGNADSLSRIEHARDPTLQEELEADEEAMYALFPMPQDDTEALKQATAEDVDLQKVIQWVRGGVKPEKGVLRTESDEVRQYMALFECLTVGEEDGLLRRRRQEGEHFEKDRLCLPYALVNQAVRECHEMTGGHMAVAITRTRFLGRFYVPGAYKIIEDFVSRCHACQAKRGANKPQRHSYVDVNVGNAMQVVFVDLVGPQRPSSRGNIYLFTIRDAFTRWLEAIPTECTKAATLARMLEEFISKHGAFESCHSDNGPQMTAELLAEVLGLLGINKTETPPYSPQSNPVERSHRDLKSVLKGVCYETGQDWEEVLPVALLALRTSRNRHTGVSPFYALYGREAKLPIDLIYPNKQASDRTTTVVGREIKARMAATFRYVRNNLKLAVERTRMNYNGKLSKKPLVEHDLVWLFTPAVKKGANKKTSVFWSGPWKITKCLSSVLYAIETHGTWNRHHLETVVTIDRLQRYLEDTHKEPRPHQLRKDDVDVEDEFLEGGDANLEDLPQFGGAAGGGLEEQEPLPPPMPVPEPPPEEPPPPPPPRSPPPPPHHYPQEEEMEEGAAAAAAEGDDGMHPDDEDATGGRADDQPLGPDAQDAVVGPHRLRRHIRPVGEHGERLQQLRAQRAALPPLPAHVPRTRRKRTPERRQEEDVAAAATGGKRPPQPEGRELQRRQVQLHDPPHDYLQLQDEDMRQEMRMLLPPAEQPALLPPTERPALLPPAEEEMRLAIMPPSPRPRPALMPPRPRPALMPPRPPPRPLPGVRFSALEGGQVRLALMPPLPSSPRSPLPPLPRSPLPLEGGQRLALMPPSPGAVRPSAPDDNLMPPFYSNVNQEPRVEFPDELHETLPRPPAVASEEAPSDEVGTNDRNQSAAAAAADTDRPYRPRPKGEKVVKEQKPGALKTKANALWRHRDISIPTERALIDISSGNRRRRVRPRSEEREEEQKRFAPPPRDGPPSPPSSSRRAALPKIRILPRRSPSATPARARPAEEDPYRKVYKKKGDRDAPSAHSAAQSGRGRTRDREQN